MEPSGNVLETQVVEHEMSIPHSGWTEQDADTFLAGLAAGILKPSDISRWVQLGFTIQPNPANKPLYDAFYNDYRLLYERTREIVHRLGES